MINEDYCSFEVAKLLKEKGFNEPCTELNKLCLRDGEKPVLKVTHQKAMKWLREEKHYYIQIMLDSWALGGHTGYYVIIQRIDNDFEMMLQDALDEVFYNTYEEAVEAALKYSLENLI